MNPDYKERKAREFLRIIIHKCSRLLSHVALRGGVEGGHLHGAGILRSHLKQNLFEGVKLAALSVHVILVDLPEENGFRTNSVYTGIK